MDEAKKPELPPCPECDKMVAVHEKSQAIGEFLDWLQGERGIVLAKWSDTDEDDEEVDDHLVIAPVRIEDLLAEYFEIDLKKVEQERQALLDRLRAAWRE